MVINGLLIVSTQSYFHIISLLLDNWDHLCCNLESSPVYRYAGLNQFVQLLVVFSCNTIWDLGYWKHLEVFFMPRYYFKISFNSLENT